MPGIGHLHTQRALNQALNRKRVEVLFPHLTHISYYPVNNPLPYFFSNIQLCMLCAQGIRLSPFASRRTSIYIACSIRTIHNARLALQTAHRSKRSSGRLLQIFLVDRQHVVLQSHNLKRPLRLKSPIKRNLRLRFPCHPQT